MRQLRSASFDVCAKNPRSRYHLSLCISYPNAEHAARGLAAGLISGEEHAQILLALQARRMPPQHTRLGGEIYIHGRSDHDEPQGTRGCISLSNDHMGELFEQIALGTAVFIRE
jgi:murein L,D-transpeptidase YafK